MVIDRLRNVPGSGVSAEESGGTYQFNDTDIAFLFPNRTILRDRSAVTISRCIVEPPVLCTVDNRRLRTPACGSAPDSGLRIYSSDSGLRISSGLRPADSLLELIAVSEVRRLIRSPQFEIRS